MIMAWQLFSWGLLVACAGYNAQESLKAWKRVGMKLSLGFAALHAILCGVALSYFLCALWVVLR